jgi:prophage DNA circulation protein
MSWRDNLLDAAIDGVPFLYEEVENSFGRRTSVHEFPDRNDPFTDDLGKAARKFTIRAFLIGENYAENRDSLIEVLEAAGDKVFTHPYRGDFGVKVDGLCRMSERHDQGRYCEFTIPLVEAGLAFPTIQLLTLPNIGFIVPDLNGKIPNTKFSLLGAIGAVLKSIIAGLNKAASLLRKINGKIASALNLVDSLSGAIDAFVDALDTLIGAPFALLNELTQLANSVMGLIDTFVDLVPNLDVDVPEPDFPKLTLEVLEEMFSFETEAEAIPTPTPQSEQEVEGHAVITKVFKAASLAAGTEQLAKLELDSAEQAKDIMTNLSDKFDFMLSQDFEPEIMESMIALKGAMVEHFSKQAASLPSVTTTRINYPEPALTLSYRLYGDSTLDADIVKRNKIRHPTFVPAGVDLEVLSNG